MYDYHLSGRWLSVHGRWLSIHERWLLSIHRRLLTIHVGCRWLLSVHRRRGRISGCVNFNSLNSSDSVRGRNERLRARNSNNSSRILLCQSNLFFLHIFLKLLILLLLATAVYDDSNYDYCCYNDSDDGANRQSWSAYTSVAVARSAISIEYAYGIVRQIL